MPRTARRLAALRGRVARVTRVDNCGRPVYGEYNSAVSEGIITAAFTANTTEPDEINQPNFAGKRSVYEPAQTDLAGYGLELTFSQVDFEFFEIITKQPLVFADDGTVVGIEPDTKIALDQEGFALEIWTGAMSADACDDENAQGEYGYLVLPLLKGGVVGDFSVENGAISFVITGASTRDGNRWGSGPYPVELVAGVPAPLFQPMSPTAPLRIMSVTVAPPVDTVGARPLLDPTLPALTGVTAIEGATTMEAALTVTPVSTGSVWYDFGDGTWDYVVAPGGASHVYDAAGTYTVRASQNGVAWASTSVTVPFTP